MTKRRISLWLALALMLVVYACQHPKKEKKTHPDNLPHVLVKGSFNSVSKIKFDSTLVDDFLKQHSDLAVFSDDFHQFYQMNHYNLVWYDQKGLTESAINLINQVNGLQDEGVVSEIPHKQEFLKLLDVIHNSESQKPLVEVELFLTGQYFNYARHVWVGAGADQAKKLEWYLPRKKLSYNELLAKNLKLGSDSIEQAAVIPQYRSLKKALNHYQQMERSGKDIPVASIAALRSLALGDSSKLLIDLKRRLQQLGDFKENNLTHHYDSVLRAAILSFKERHGLNPTAQIDGIFLKKLNVPLRKRIEQMIVNLERMRWIPSDDHGGDFLLVNIPEFKLHYFVDNHPDWACNVVVGKVMNKTVIFSGHLQYIVFSPYWYVPPSIIEKEIKPAMNRNANYLSAHRMEWNGGNVRQKPGKDNSLGLVKFIFPNANNIYLHDTPSKSLFNEESRAFSHGCIRVAEPVELARRLLKGDSLWTVEKITQAMKAGVERKVLLQNKLPVYIGYFTAFVNSKGVLNFRDDIYQRDDRLLKMLMSL